MQKRRFLDLSKLLLGPYHVETRDSEIFVDFPAPKDSLYEGGVYKIRLELPEKYPIKSPSVGFVTKIFHPNVDEVSGTVCLDVLNQTWSPMYELKNIFDVFLPQLLLYPNPSDPLNSEAASLLLKRPESYRRKVREMVVKFATPEVQPQAVEIAEINRSDLSELSDTSELDMDLM